MPVGVMIWNVQNFGQGTAFYNTTKGLNSVQLAQFIARVAAAQANLGVLFMLEVMPGALPHLQQVMHALNAVASGGLNDWMFDWVKGSVGVVNPAAPVAAPADTSWRSGGQAPRQEGYAVFWRNGHEGFRMMRAETGMSEGTWRSAAYAPAYDPGNVASLSLHGRDVARIRPAYPALRPIANFAVGGAPWGALFPTSYYPDVGRIFGAGALYYSDTRRPAYAVIRLNTADPIAARVVPIMAFHAPSYAPVASAGTFVASMARELYALKTIDANDTPTGPLFNPVKFIAGGDFNVTADGDNHWDDTFGGFWRAYPATLPTDAPYGGANSGGSVYNNAGPITTTIQINARNVAGIFIGPAIFTGNRQDYEFSAIDNMFYRGFMPATALVADMLSMLMGAGGVNPNIQAGIQAYGPAMLVLHGTNGGANANTGPVDAAGNSVFNCFDNYGGGVGTWLSFLVDVLAGQFTTARSAAVFCRMFVSDHRPLLVVI